ncbi:MAG: ATP-binding cassette domain-containing protein [Lachnospiraceae bacterium]|nr:ATP-binding cassette domain-containing protein [Lachnospiraceae bacterium]
MEEQKVLLSVKDLWVKFRVRGRVLTAIRGISLDIYEGESIAIVGESGSGKSVFTKTFSGMNDANGFIDQGTIIFNDEDLADTTAPLNDRAKRLIEKARQQLDQHAKLELGALVYRKLQELESEKHRRESVSEEDQAREKKELADLNAKRTDLYNLKQTLDPHKEKDKIHEMSAQISALDRQIKEVQKKDEALSKEQKKKASQDTAFQKEYEQKKSALQAEYDKLIQGSISEKTKKRNEILAKEIYLSIGRYDARQRRKLAKDLVEALKKAMQLGVDLDDENERNKVFDTVAFRVRYLDETADTIHGTCVLNLANVKYAQDWSRIRGKKIATVFQDPMTSLNPILTIGKQITSIIIKHQGCSEGEARKRALVLMHKVGIPNAEARFDDYPFQYSGGMRQRIVIAIALSCQPKILICDEPTTALDVTIQAQILQLLKDLQKELGFTIVFITHDLGVVANIADRVAVLYAGQIVELGKVEEVFYDPRHPYTWALLSSLPQLAQRNTKLYSITGTPPSLYNQIVGDAFAPRNPYCMKIDTLEEPPMFPVTETHFAKTWLLDEDAPEVEGPEAIRDLHQKLLDAYHLA